MNEQILAARLAEADADERRTLLAAHAALVGAALAAALKNLCYEAWLVDPQRTKRIIAALVATAEISGGAEAQAIAEWSLGIGEILHGQMRTACEFFDQSERRFLALGERVAAAETQVGKLYALAVLGLYDDALECGLRARDVFLQCGQALAAGKIEHNLGNLYQRRDRYDRAEHFLRMARERFEAAGEVRRLIQSDNSLANALAHQHKFREAARIYEEALAKAAGEGLEVTEAELESNLGHLLLFEGRFDRALRFFESSRRRYERMQMPHQMAIAEQEIADSYLELNLAPEAAAIYTRVAQVFDELEMKAERARALANLARALIAAGDTARAHELLAEAERLFADERNFVGAATVKLTEAMLYHTEKNHRAALEKAAAAEPVFAEAAFNGRALAARWLRGESHRLAGADFAARTLLRSALREAEAGLIAPVSLRCYTSLGLVERAAGDRAAAEDCFQRAVAIVEEMRAPLPAEDFRTAFLADKLTPYDELIRLYAENGDAESVEKAFVLAETARSRVLSEMLEGDFAANARAARSGGGDADGPLERLREELNWLYHRLNRAPLEGGFDAAQSARLEAQIRERENEILEINRKQRIFARPDAFGRTETLDLRQLRALLGAETALVEYYELDGHFSAFVVTDEGLEFVPRLAAAGEVRRNLAQFRRQIDAMKMPAARGRASHYETTALARTQLHALYRQLFRPLEELIGWRRLVVVPHGALHYVPFHALFDGFGYAAETREIVYAPSARIFKHCLAKRKNAFRRALLVGARTEQTPEVAAEIETLAGVFPDAEILLDEQATRAALAARAPAADVVHLACHGRFRPDNPLFSALQLADGWFNVRDSYDLRLAESLVVLSACETGLNSVAAGDELLGLARGFLSAGASALVLSLWQVDDATTAELMSVFYRRLQNGLTPAVALRDAQIELMRTHPHPFFWSPFILVGGF